MKQAIIQSNDGRYIKTLSRTHSNRSENELCNDSKDAERFNPEDIEEIEDWLEPSWFHNEKLDFFTVLTILVNDENED